MRKYIIPLFAGLFGSILGVAAGFALGIFVYPFWFLNDAAMEQVAGRENRTVAATGIFIHANPSDPIHWGRGDLTLFDDAATGPLLHLEGNFEVGPGPRFHVYLVAGETPPPAAAFENGEALDLGRLKAFKGSQSYAVPADTDLAAYKGVVIWCKEFGVLISPAALAKTQPAVEPTS